MLVKVDIVICTVQKHAGFLGLAGMYISSSIVNPSVEELVQLYVNSLGHTHPQLISLAEFNQKFSLDKRAYTRNIFGKAKTSQDQTIHVKRGKRR